MLTTTGILHQVFRKTKKTRRHVAFWQRIIWAQTGGQEKLSPSQYAYMRLLHEKSSKRSRFVCSVIQTSLSPEQQLQAGKEAIQQYIRKYAPKED